MLHRAVLYVMVYWVALQLHAQLYVEQSNNNEMYEWCCWRVFETRTTCLEYII